MMLRFTRGLESITAVTRHSLLRELDVDLASPLLLATALLPNVQARTGTIANISSDYGSISLAGTGRAYPYCISKAALNMGTRLLALEEQQRLRCVVAMHPGSVLTDMNAHGDVTVGEAARSIAGTIEQLGSVHTGTLVDRHGVPMPW